jgi:hypothetical protein
MLIKASCNLFLFNKAITDLNSGQLVRVHRIKNHITHLGDFDASAVNETTGSRKYHVINRIIIHRGKNNLLTIVLSSSISSC